MPKISISLGTDEHAFTPDQHALNDAVFEAAQDLLTAMMVHEVRMPESLDETFHAFVTSVDLALGYDPQQEE